MYVCIMYMCVCVCVCTYVCMYVCVCVYVYMYVFMYDIINYYVSMRNNIHMYVLLLLISQLGHEVYQPGAAGYSQVVEEFGEGMSMCSHQSGVCGILMRVHVV